MGHAAGLVGLFVYMDYEGFCEGHWEDTAVLEVTVRPQITPVSSLA